MRHAVADQSLNRPTTPAYRRVLVPLDAGAPSASAFDQALALADHCGAELRAIHVLDDGSFTISTRSNSMHWSIEAAPDGMAALAAARQRARERGVSFSTQVLDRSNGDLPSLLGREALRWQADLMVVGTHARRGLPRVVLGSDAETIVRRAPIPVMLVPCRDM